MSSRESARETAAREAATKALASEFTLVTLGRRGETWDEQCAAMADATVDAYLAASPVVDDAPSETCDECGRADVLEPTNHPEHGGPICPTCAVTEAVKLGESRSPVVDDAAIERAAKAWWDHRFASADEPPPWADASPGERDYARGLAKDLLAAALGGHGA